MKNTIIKYVIRIAGALCILGALAIMFFTTWVRVENVSRKDIRQFREARLNEITLVRQEMTQMIEIDRYKDDLKENDVPCTKAEIKKHTKKAEELTKTILDDQISLKELFVVSSAMPGIAENAQNLLDCTFCGKLLYNDTLDYNILSIETAVESVVNANYVFYAILIFLGLMALLGIAAAVLHVLHIAGWVKYLFAVYVLILALVFFVGIPLVSNMVLAEMNLPAKYDDLSLRVTIMPALAVLLSIVPIVLSIVFKKKEKPALT